MKKFRPHNAGYIVVYVVVILAILESLWTIYTMFLQAQNPQENTLMDSFFIWTLLILPVAVIFGNR